MESNYYLHATKHVKHYKKHLRNQICTCSDEFFHCVGYTSRPGKEAEIITCLLAFSNLNKRHTLMVSQSIINTTITHLLASQVRKIL